MKSVDWNLPGVYRCTNLITGHVYIGSSIGPCNKRKYAHVSQLNNNKHSNGHFQNAWNKYGEINFLWEVLENVGTPEMPVTTEQVREIEQRYINATPKELLYNIKFSIQKHDVNASAREKRKKIFRYQYKRLFDYVFNSYVPDDILSHKWYYRIIKYGEEITEKKISLMAERLDTYYAYQEGVYLDEDEIREELLGY